MVGAKAGVETHTNKIESHVYLTHCHDLALQLAVETIKPKEIMRYSWGSFWIE